MTTAQCLSVGNVPDMSSQNLVQNATNSTCNGCLQSQPGCGPGFKCGPLFKLLFLRWFRFSEFVYYLLADYSPCWQFWITVDQYHPDLRVEELVFESQIQWVLGFTQSLNRFYLQCLLWCLIVNGNVAIFGRADPNQLYRVSVSLCPQYSNWCSVSLTYRARCQRET